MPPSIPQIAAPSTASPPHASTSAAQVAQPLPGVSSAAPHVPRLLLQDAPTVSISQAAPIRASSQSIARAEPMHPGMTQTSGNRHEASLRADHWQGPTMSTPAAAGESAAGALSATDAQPPGLGASQLGSSTPDDVQLLDASLNSDTRPVDPAGQVSIKQVSDYRPDACHFPSPPFSFSWGEVGCDDVLHGWPSDGMPPCHGSCAW